MTSGVGPVRLVASVRGSVQGVGFRWFVQREAAGMDLVGWVMNEADGSVSVMAEGPAVALDRLVRRLWEGPGGAAVMDVAVRHEPARGGFASFSIRSGAHRGD